MTTGGRRPNQGGTVEADIAERMGVGPLLAEIADALESGMDSHARQLAASLRRPPTTTISFRLPVAARTAAQAARVKVPSLTPRQKLDVYKADGFRCRLSPERWRLVHPGALRVLSLRLPDQIPTALSRHNIPARHVDNAPVWFDVWPAVDHAIPRWMAGGTNLRENLICASWWRNDSKAGRTIEETGWELQPSGSLEEWDGLMGWFHRQVEADEGLLADRMVRNWRIP